MELLPEVIQSHIALFAVAGLAGSDLVMDALDPVAGRALVVDFEVLGDDMLFVEVVGSSAVDTLLFGFYHLPVLSQDVRPFHLPRLEFFQCAFYEGVALLFRVRSKRAFANYLGILVSYHVLDGVDGGIGHEEYYYLKFHFCIQSPLHTFSLRISMPKIFCRFSS